MRDADNNGPGTSCLGASKITNDLWVTVFDGDKQPKTIYLNSFRKETITFGRDKDNDIVLNSHLVSRKHGRFSYRNGEWRIEDKALFKKWCKLQEAMNEGEFDPDIFSDLIDQLDQWKKASECFSKKIKAIGSLSEKLSEQIKKI